MSSSSIWRSWRGAPFMTSNSFEMAGSSASGNGPSQQPSSNPAARVGARAIHSCIMARSNFERSSWLCLSTRPRCAPMCRANASPDGTLPCVHASTRRRSSRRGISTTYERIFVPSPCLRQAGRTTTSPSTRCWLSSPCRAVQRPNPTIAVASGSQAAQASFSMKAGVLRQRDMMSATVRGGSPGIRSASIALMNRVRASNSSSLAVCHAKGLMVTSEWVIVECSCLCTL